MISMTARGLISKWPEKKVSQNGVPYLRFQIDIPAKQQGKWPERVYCTAFDQVASEWSERLVQGMEVELSGKPSSSAYTNKMGKPAATLNCVVYRLAIVSAPAQAQAPQPAPQSDKLPWRPEQQAPESKFDDSDIPF